MKIFEQNLHPIFLSFSPEIVKRVTYVGQLKMSSITPFHCHKTIKELNNYNNVILGSYLSLFELEIFFK